MGESIAFILVRRVKFLNIRGFIRHDSQTRIDVNPTAKTALWERANKPTVINNHLETTSGHRRHRESRHTKRQRRVNNNPREYRKRLPNGMIPTFLDKQLDLIILRKGISLTGHGNRQFFTRKERLRLGTRTKPGILLKPRNAPLPRGIFIKQSVAPNERIADRLGRKTLIPNLFRRFNHKSPDREINFLVGKNRTFKKRVLPHATPFNGILKGNIIMRAIHFVQFCRLLGNSNATRQQQATDRKNELKTMAPVRSEIPGFSHADSISPIRPHHLDHTTRARSSLLLPRAWSRRDDASHHASRPWSRSSSASWELA